MFFAIFCCASPPKESTALLSRFPFDFLLVICPHVWAFSYISNLHVRLSVAVSTAMGAFFQGVGRRCLLLFIILAPLLVLSKRFPSAGSVWARK
jgi:hypothetical protein